MAERLIPAIVLLFLSAMSNGQAPTRVIDQPVSGYHFQSQQEQQLQDDSFANPGLLWVDEGEVLFHKEHKEYQEYNDQRGNSCATCHDVSGAFATSAATFPNINPTTGQLVNLEAQINFCSQTRQGRNPMAYDSQPLLALSAYVAHLGKGRNLQPPADDPQLQEALQAGRNYYYQRRGQLNLACNHCHELHYGKMLRGDRLSQGHSNGYPAYKLEWQGLGSLYRRLHDCHVGVRAEPFLPNSREHLNLELFLTLRAAGLRLESPAVRR